MEAAVTGVDAGGCGVAVGCVVVGGRVGGGVGWEGLQPTAINASNVVVRRVEVFMA
jgi:hypothetical protein